MVALYFLVKRHKYFLSGLILGTGLYLREEMYFAAFAVGVALYIEYRLMQLYLVEAQIKQRQTPPRQSCPDFGQA